MNEWELNSSAELVVNKIGDVLIVAGEEKL